VEQSRRDGVEKARKQEKMGAMLENSLRILLFDKGMPVAYNGCKHVATDFFIPIKTAPLLHLGIYNPGRGGEGCRGISVKGGTGGKKP